MKIRFDQITKTYGRQCTLYDVSFSLNSGEIIGLIGPNGAGKSTLIKILMGLVSPDRGLIFFNEQNIDPTRINYKKHIGYLPENNPLPKEFYVKEYLSHIAALHGLRNYDETSLLKVTALADSAHQKIEALSKGYRQRLGLAASILHKPEKNN